MKKFYVVNIASFLKETINLEKKSLYKIPQLHLSSWRGNIVETHSLHRAFWESSKTLLKVFVSTKFPYQKIR